LPRLYSRLQVEPAPVRDGAQIPRLRGRTFALRTMEDHRAATLGMTNETVVHRDAVILLTFGMAGMNYDGAGGTTVIEED
jgi:hypothetical protein